MKHRSLAPVLVVALLIVLGTAIPGIAASATQPGGPKPNPGLGPAQFKGVIEQMPSGMIGSWRVSGRTIEVTKDTQIQQNKGTAKVGAKTPEKLLDGGNLVIH